LLLLGAIIFHVRAADSVADMAPAVIGLGLAVATAILQAALTKTACTMNPTCPNAAIA